MAKRVSTDEKLTKIINFLKSTNSIYSIKELEKKLTKECAISPMLVPELIKKLMDENMISMEKCGASNIFWCFKYQKQHFYSCEIEKSEELRKVLEEEINKKTIALNKIKDSRKPSIERDELLEEYNKLKLTVQKIDEKRNLSEEFSFKSFLEMKKETELLKKESEKLTDNIFALQSFSCKKFGMSKKEFGSNFDIPNDFDYIN